MKPMEKSADNAGLNEVLRLMSHSPLYQGYLFKESSFHKAFNKRYFVLYENLLVYYKEEEQFLKRSSPEARLKRSTNIIHLEGCYLTKPKTLPYGAKFCFILHVPHKSNRRTEIKLVSKTKNDKHMWISLLQAQNSKLVCQPSTITHSFRQAIQKSHSFVGSFASITSTTSGVDDAMAYACTSSDEFTLGDDQGLTFKVESHHFHNPHLHRSLSAYRHHQPRLSPKVPSIQHSLSSELTDNQ